MAIRSYTLGPGTLTFNSGTAFDATAQVTKCSVEWDESVDSTDPIPVLSGEKLAGVDTPTYASKLTGEFLQDLELTGLVAWSWTKKGQTVTFVFTPNTVGATKVTGTCRVVPLTLGGDVAKKGNASAFSWACMSDPVIS